VEFEETLHDPALPLVAGPPDPGTPAMNPQLTVGCCADCPSPVSPPDPALPLWVVVDATTASVPGPPDTSRVPSIWTCPVAQMSSVAPPVTWTTLPAGMFMVVKL
jgi:hypothetical protein